MPPSVTTAEPMVQAEVGEFYDEMSWVVEILGGNIHVGWWWSDEDRTPLLEAINRFTDLVGDKLELRPGERLLDVGCGAGVPAIRLAQRTDAEVVGITNSQAHRWDATRRVVLAGLRGQVRVELGDAAALEYPDGSFDAVLALESLVHATDRAQWLREMCRVLRPGGRVVLADLTEDTPLTDDETGMFLGSSLAPPLPLRELVDTVRRSGFVVTEFVQCGDRVRRSYQEYYDRIANRRDELVAAHGAAPIEAFLEHMPPFQQLLRAKTGYAVVVGRKPAG